MSAFVAVCLSALRAHRLAPGERGTVLIIAADRRQARVIFNYAQALLESTPALSELIVRQTQNVIDLSTGVSIEIATASFRLTRGYSLIAVLLDELAFLRSDESANPDTEIVRAIRPGLVTVAGSMLVYISSPYAMKGELYRTYEKWFGRDGDVLVWQAASTVMNPRISQSIVDRAFNDDAAAAAAEWHARFRDDLASMFDPATLAAVIVPGRHELLPSAGCAYVGFVDMSGGRGDSAALAIAHRQADGKAVLDLVREVHPPFDPSVAVASFVSELRRYNVSTIIGDRYAAEWPVE
jgi:hypothetical protein